MESARWLKNCINSAWYGMRDYLLFRMINARLHVAAQHAEVVKPDWI
jgi:hypothetical protein